MLEILSKVGWIMLGSIPVIIFQVIKWLINNHKLKKEFSQLKVEKLANSIDYEKLANSIDYGKLVKLVLKELEEKQECQKN